ncbi:MAG TPA: hypothetical protein VEL28_03510 [Candidatus Binatia bacterium]|nr:hypothetical protein [Candidatus Binatia bacterium]
MLDFDRARSLARFLFMSGFVALGVATPFAAYAAFVDCTSTIPVSGDDLNFDAGVYEGLRTTSSTAPCIELGNGKDVDLNGAPIVCASAGGTCGVAIKALAANSVAHDGRIEGNFSVAVQGVTEVKNLKIDGSELAVDGNDRTLRVFGNVFRNVWGGVVLGDHVVSTSFARQLFRARPSQ